MDMFTDKLAQKLAAQEIISANSAADAEQINRLKNQIAEYDECLHRLRGLIEEGTEQLRSSRASGTDVDRLVEEGIAKIRAMQQDTAALEEFVDRLESRIDKINSGIDDNVHRECVKVYRNVQAVVAEGNEKDLKLTEQLTEEVKKSGRRMKVILGVTIAALLFSIAGFVLALIQFL